MGRRLIDNKCRDLTIARQAFANLADDLEFWAATIGVGFLSWLIFGGMGIYFHHLGFFWFGVGCGIFMSFAFFSIAFWEECEYVRAYSEQGD